MQPPMNERQFKISVKKLEDKCKQEETHRSESELDKEYYLQQVMMKEEV